MNPDKLEIPDELRQAQREGKLVIFAGAGVSVNPPSYIPLKEQLCNEISEMLSKTDRTYRRRKNQEPEDYYQELRRREQRISEIYFFALRRSCANSSPNHLHRDIARLFNSLTDVKIVTINHDEHLTEACRTVFNEWPHQQLLIHHSYHSPTLAQYSGIMYLHGCLSQPPEHLVFDRRTEEAAYLYETMGIKLFLKNLLLRYTFVFLGCSFKDDKLVKYIEYLVETKELTKSNYIFIIESEVTTSLEQRLRKCLITPVLFKEYQVLADCLKEWADTSTKADPPQLWHPNTSLPNRSKTR